jgi:osmotically-inducible protein OsmY
MNIRLRSALFETAALTAAIFFFAAATKSAIAQPEMTDRTINDKIDDDLLLDPGVISLKVDVSTSNGIVTLTGQVNNILAKERAARIAETVKGVRAVVNRIEVSKVASLSDSQIRRDVEAALLANPATDSYKITSTAQNGVVTLTGTVDSYQERDLVKTVAKGVRGVTAIKDEIDVNYKTDRTDAEIKNEIDQALRWNRYVDHFLINGSVNDGKVTLSGTVGSAAERRMAESVAWVAGVASVDSSNLSVEGWARDDKLRVGKYDVKSADDLRNAVKDALLYDPRVMSSNVDVYVSGRTVTLRGEVDNLKARRAAEQDAKNTVGVSYVVNRLKVRLDAWPEDSEVAEKIRAALVRDPYVERFEVTVVVVDGTAHLYGSVDSYFEKNRADDVAASVLGVLDVENHLSVDFDRPYIYSPYLDDTIGEDELIHYERRAPLKTDRQIKDSIESQLWWSPFVSSDQVTVTVADGIATLTGTVDTWNERDAATENAYQGGATLVKNDLVVDYDY